MDIVLVTGANGLIGSEACRFYGNLGYMVIGIDNDMRSYFFGVDASTKLQEDKLKNEIPYYIQYNVDIRNINEINNIFNEYNSDIKLVIHCAAQPSHDWAVKEPITDFTVNANGTLNLLEATRNYCPDAVFIFTSTNKVYGDRPNTDIPLIELDKRWEIDYDKILNKEWYLDKGISYNGVSELMSIDNSKHSIFGASKVAADVMVQEYGKYFGMNTCVMRGGCLTGPGHSGAELHGFLSYLVKCAVNKKLYTIFGYNGKQVRDNIHSYDLINAFHKFYLNPKPGEVYNMGGSRHSNISILEAIDLIKEISGDVLEFSISPENRIGDHIWYISDINKFKNDYPDWEYKYDIKMILSDMINVIKK